MRNTLVVAAICAISIGQAEAAAVEKLENIRAAVHEFAVREVRGDDENIKIKVGRLDPRLRLAACGEPLETYFSPGTKTIGQTNVGVRCEGPKPWSLFVPLHIDRLVKVAIAVSAVTRGHVISAADVSYELRSLAGLRGGYFAAKDELLGKVSTRSITRGSPFAQNMVKAQRLVQRGERVVLALKTGSVGVRVAGKALSDGIRGEQISVQNLSSKRVIKGVVHDRGLVLVGRPRADL